MRNLRRLFNIMPKHVSLVDSAANMKKFYIVKNKEEQEESMEEILKALEKIQDALNDMNDKIAEVDKKASTPVPFELDKAGAKIAGATLDRMKNLYDTLGEIITGAAGKQEEDPNEEMSSDDVSKAILSGVNKTLNPEEKKDDNDQVAAIVKAVMLAMDKKEGE